MVLVITGCSAGGSAPDWGSGGRKFKSCHSDQKKSFAIARLFFIQSKGLVCNHASACMLLPKAYGITLVYAILRIDYIPKQVSDYIHCFAVVTYATKVAISYKASP